MSTISDRIFDHYRVNSLSLYILVNKEHVADKENFITNIIEGVKKLYQ